MRWAQHIHSVTDGRRATQYLLRSLSGGEDNKRNLGIGAPEATWAVKEYVIIRYYIHITIS